MDKGLGLVHYDYNEEGECYPEPETAYWEVLALDLGGKKGVMGANLELFGDPC